MSSGEFAVVLIVAVTVAALLLRQQAGLRGRAMRLAKQWERARHEMLVMRATEARIRRGLRSELHRHHGTARAEREGLEAPRGHRMPGQVDPDQGRP